MSATISPSTNSSWSTPGRRVEADGANQVAVHIAASPRVSAVSGRWRAEHRFQLLGIRAAALVGPCLLRLESDRLAVLNRLFVPDARQIRIRQHIATALSKIFTALDPDLLQQYRTNQVVPSLRV